MELLAVELVTGTAVTSNITDYRTFTVSKRAASDYSTDIQLAHRNTSSDSVTAWTPWTISLTGSESELQFARGDLMTFKSGHNAIGVALLRPKVQFELDAIGPRTVDIWVY
jgi:hypothetical protein